MTVTTNSVASHTITIGGIVHVKRMEELELMFSLLWPQGMHQRYSSVFITSGLTRENELTQLAQFTKTCVALLIDVVIFEITIQNPPTKIFRRLSKAHTPSVEPLILYDPVALAEDDPT